MSANAHRIINQAKDTIGRDKKIVTNIKTKTNTNSIKESERIINTAQRNVSEANIALGKNNTAKAAAAAVAEEQARAAAAAAEAEEQARAAAAAAAAAKTARQQAAAEQARAAAEAARQQAAVAAAAAEKQAKVAAAAAAESARKEAAAEQARAAAAAAAKNAEEKARAAALKAKANANSKAAQEKAEKTAKEAAEAKAAAEAKRLEEETAKAEQERAAAAAEAAAAEAARQREAEAAAAARAKAEAEAAAESQRLANAAALEAEQIKKEAARKAQALINQARKAPLTNQQAWEVYQREHPGGSINNFRRQRGLPNISGLSAARASSLASYRPPIQQPSTFSSFFTPPPATNPLLKPTEGWTIKAKQPEAIWANYGNLASTPKTKRNRPSNRQRSQKETRISVTNRCGYCNATGNRSACAECNHIERIQSGKAGNKAYTPQLGPPKQYTPISGSRGRGTRKGGRRSTRRKNKAYTRRR